MWKEWPQAVVSGALEASEASSEAPDSVAAGPPMCAVLSAPADAMHSSALPSVTAGSPPSVPADAPPAATTLVLPSSSTHDAVYCCQRCRRPLFAPAHLTSHEAGQHAFAYRRAAKERSAASSVSLGAGGAGEGGGAGGEGASGCTSHFLAEALQWMEAASSDVEGKLTCPKCAVRVGSVKWAGGQCSCECGGGVGRGGAGLPRGCAQRCPQLQSPTTCLEEGCVRTACRPYSSSPPPTPTHPTPPPLPPRPRQVALGSRRRCRSLKRRSTSASSRGGRSA